LPTARLSTTKQRPSTANDVSIELPFLQNTRALPTNKRTNNDGTRPALRTSRYTLERRGLIVKNNKKSQSNLGRAASRQRMASRSSLPSCHYTPNRQTDRLSVSTNTRVAVLATRLIIALIIKICIYMYSPDGRIRHDIRCSLSIHLLSAISRLPSSVDLFRTHKS